MKQIVLFAFRGDPMCFVHVLLNAIDLDGKGLGGKIVIEGEATKLVPEMAKAGHFLNALYLAARERSLIDAVCRACSVKMGVLDAVEKEGLPLVSDMSGHPAMAGYVAAGYEVVTM